VKRTDIVLPLGYDDDIDVALSVASVSEPCRCVGHTGVDVKSRHPIRS